MGSVLSTLTSLTNQLFCFLSFYFSLHQQQILRSQPKETHFDDLYEDVVFEIFSRLTTTELLATERVSKSWQRLVKEMLKRIETLETRPLEEYDELYENFTVCSHLSDTRQTMSLKKLFDFLKTKVEELVGKGWHRWSDGLRMARGKQLFVSCLYKLSGVRSINFSYQEITVQTLVQAFELCPKLKCINISRTAKRSYSLDKDDWTNFVDRFGHRLKHISIDSSINNCEKLLQSLDRPYIKLERFCFPFLILTNEVFTLIKRFQEPNKAYVGIKFEKFRDVPILTYDFIDEMSAYELHWSALPDDCQRLSVLSFKILAPEWDIPNQAKSVKFSALKRLSIDNFTNIVLDVCSRGQFPAVEKLKLQFFENEIIFDIDHRLYQFLQKMPALVELELFHLSHDQKPVPGPTILQLKRLAKLAWYVVFFPDWDLQVVTESLDFIQQVQSLKILKLGYKFNFENNWPVEQLNQWREAIEQRLAAMEQQRPELIILKVY